MVDKLKHALSSGEIISVDWRGIQEMLGEAPERNHNCSICAKGAFPPKPLETVPLTEAQIYDVLCGSGRLYMAEVFQNGLPYMPAETRYFCTEPQEGPWIAPPQA